MTAALEWGPGSGAKIGGMKTRSRIKVERRSNITQKAGRRTVARLNFLSGGRSDGTRQSSEIGMPDL